MNKHTLILTPGTWRIDGKFVNESNVQSPAEGTIRIEHSDEFWLYSSRIQIGNTLEPDIKQEWRIQPWNGRHDYLNWQAENTLMGNLKGKILFIAETILCQFFSDKGDYMGSEVMLMQEDDKYYNRGTTFVGDHKLHSWSFHLHRTY